MTNEEHPFIPGARVAIKSTYHGVREGRVDKLHKTGRFTLVGSPSQWRASLWRPSGDEPPRWYALKTGDRWSRDQLLLWDETTDAELRAEITVENRRRSFRDIKARLDRIPDGQLTDEFVSYLDAALRTIEGKTDE